MVRQNRKLQSHKMLDRKTGQCKLSKKIFELFYCFTCDQASYFSQQLEPLIVGQFLTLYLPKTSCPVMETWPFNSSGPQGVPYLGAPWPMLPLCSLYTLLFTFVAERGSALCNYIFLYDIYLYRKMNRKLDTAPKNATFKTGDVITNMCKAATYVSHDEKPRM